MTERSTQVVQQILEKAGIRKVRSTQVVQQVLEASGIKKTRTTQVVQQVLRTIKTATPFFSARIVEYVQ